MIGYNIDLELGKTYTVSVRIDNGHVLNTENLLFIQTTPKGYNFLNTKTCKCVFKGGFYKSNKTGKFFISKRLKIYEKVVD